YGRRDALDLQVGIQNASVGGIRHIGGGYVRFPVNWGTAARPITETWDDLFTGRLITFTAGPLQNRTFRVVRSRVVAPTPGTDVLYIRLDQGLVSTDDLNEPNQDDVVESLRPLFYPGAMTSVGYT